jgi:hypothetical protein
VKDSFSACAWTPHRIGEGPVVVCVSVSVVELQEIDRSNPPPIATPEIVVRSAVEKTIRTSQSLVVDQFGCGDRHEDAHVRVHTSCLSCRIGTRRKRLCTRPGFGDQWRALGHSGRWNTVMGQLFRSSLSGN